MLHSCAEALELVDHGLRVLVGVSDRSHRAHLPRSRRRPQGRGADQLHLVLDELVGELVADGPGVEHADAPADAQAVDGAEVPQLERQRRAALGQHLLGDRHLLERARVAGAVLAAALGAAGEEHAGRAQAGRLHDVQGAHSPEARQLDEPHALGVLVAPLAGEADGGAGALLAVEADDRLVDALRHGRDATEQGVVAEVVGDRDLGAVGGADAAGAAALGVDDGELAVILHLVGPRLPLRPVDQRDGVERAHRRAGVAADALGGVDPRGRRCRGARPT